MSAVTTAFERAAAPPRTCWTHHARHVVQALLVLLDRLVPSPGDAARETEPPPEWFKYPPI
jgi:hypothetical protein